MGAAFAHVRFPPVVYCLVTPPPPPGPACLLPKMGGKHRQAGVGNLDSLAWGGSWSTRAGPLLARLANPSHAPDRAPWSSQCGVEIGK